MSITIPVSVTAANHCTSGLDGYPAIDFFGDLGESVFIGEAGTVIYPHMKPWVPGFGGWTFYYKGDSGAGYFITHLDEGYKVGAGRLAAGSLIGHLTRSEAHAALIGRAHVHVGNTTWRWPGHNCGTAAPLAGAAASSSVADVTDPVGTLKQKSGRMFVAWGHLRNSLDIALRASLKNANALSGDAIRRLQ